MTPSDEAGAIGGLEVLPIAFLVFVSGALLITNVWAVIDAKLAVEATAREATRAHVESSGPQEAVTRARAAAEATFAGSGRDPRSLTLSAGASGFERCAVVTYEASTEVRSARMPFLGSFGLPITVTGRHRELLDPFASGLAGSADCG